MIKILKYNKFVESPRLDRSVLLVGLPLALNIPASKRALVRGENSVDRLITTKSQVKVAVTSF